MNVLKVTSVNITTLETNVPDSKRNILDKHALQPRVSIIIVNWNGQAHIQVCLDSLSRQTFKDFEVLLVDNGSDDASLALVRRDYPWVKPILLDCNTGFASGNNRGFEHAHGEYLVTLNNDTRVADDWLEILVNTADGHPQAGMVGCRICSYFDSNLIDSVGMGICKDAMSRGRYRNKKWSDLSLPEFEPILFPSACAALYRREMVEEIGFFDEDFFAYAEDSDLGLRGRFAGWDAILATRAVVYHKYSQTSGSLSPFKVYLVERNHYWVALKNFPRCRLMLIPVFTLFRYIEQLRAIFENRGAGGDFHAENSRIKLIGAMFRGIFDSLVQVGRMYRKRRQIMVFRRLSDHECVELIDRHNISFKELLDVN